MRSDIVGTCIKSNELWPVVQQFSFARNMRADGDREFAVWLLLLGNSNVDRYGNDENALQVIPQIMNLRNVNDYANKVILCFTNECRQMNEGILRNRLKSEISYYFSTDTIECDDPENAADFPIEFFHLLYPTGLFMTWLLRWALSLCY
jgi:hypothetical protein